jgi:hypothetical protein
LIEKKLVNDPSFCRFKEEKINYLMQMALKNIVFAPFAYIVDKYRWDIFKGVVKPDDYNTVWWKMMYIVLIGP